MNTEMKNRLKELLDFAKEKGLLEVAWQEGEKRISFRRNGVVLAPPPQKAPLSPPVQAEPDDEFVCSPVVGTFRRSGSKDRPPMVVNGDRVKPGDKMAVVECMKIPNDVVSLSSGKIVKILVEDGQAVEFGQPLFSIRSANGNKNQPGK